MTDDSDDITMEPSDDEGIEGTAEQKLKVLREKLKIAQTEANEHLAGWQRAKADYVNLQKRMRESADESSRSGLTALAEELLPVYDSLEAALALAPEGELGKGLQATMRQLEASFKAHDIHKMPVEVGMPFNPHLHEPVGTVATNTESEDNTIDRVLQNGFQIGQLILRPARVVVKHFQSH
jgi:molecular chaperone GrpE